MKNCLKDVFVARASELAQYACSYDVQKESDYRSREVYWDIVKSLLIFLVILGHVIQVFGLFEGGGWENGLFKCIYMFHMPMFMVISGYFAVHSIERRGVKSLIRYAFRLLLPCVGLGIVILLLSACERGMSAFAASIGILWFLIVLFECVCLYFLLTKLKNKMFKIMVAIGVIPVALLIAELQVNWFPWPFKWQFTYLWPMFLIGVCLKKNNFSPELINFKWAIFVVLFACLWFFFSPDWYVYKKPLTLEYDSVLVDVWRSICALVGCLAFLFICKQLTPVLGNISLFCGIGRGTLALYALQGLLLYVWEVLLHGTSFTTSNYYVLILMAGLITVSLYWVYRMTSKLPLIGTLLYGEIKK